MAIPTSLDYETFLKDFSSELKDFDRTSLFLYGSSLRKDFLPGISDINGFIVLDDMFITNKNTIRELAIGLENSLGMSNIKIKTRFDLLDKGIANDGRFSVYSKSYIDYFKKNAVKLFGKYDMESMNGFDYRNSELDAIASNLGKIRRGLLYNNLRGYTQKRDFYESDIKILNRVFQLPKQLLNLSQNELEESKDDAIKEFSKEFPKYVDNSVLKEVQSLMKDSIKYESFWEGDECFNFSFDCLTEMEKMIKVYVEKFPKVSDKEVKDILSN